MGPAHIPFDSVYGRIGGSGVETTDWVTESAVRCKASVGQFGGSLASVLSAPQTTTSLTSGLSFDASMMASVSFSKDVTNMAGTGSTSVTGVGSHLGHSHIPFVSVYGRIGGSGVETTDWVN